MGNMSYCRFENTDGDLADCEDAIESILHDADASKLSRNEIRAAAKLVQRCQNIVAMLCEHSGEDNADAVDFDIAEAIRSANASIGDDGKGEEE